MTPDLTPEDHGRINETLATASGLIAEGETLLSNPEILQSTALDWNRRVVRSSRELVLMTMAMGTRFEVGTTTDIFDMYAQLDRLCGEISERSGLLAALRGATETPVNEENTTVRTTASSVPGCRSSCCL